MKSPAPTTTAVALREGFCELTEPDIWDPVADALGRWSPSWRDDPEAGRRRYSKCVLFSHSSSRLSGSAERYVALQVVVDVAGQVIEHDQALHLVRGRPVPGHADAAVQLDRLLGHERGQ